MSSAQWMRFYAPACVSGILFALTFYPLYVWPFAFVVLAPLFYVAANSRYSKREVFLSGFLVGAIGIGPLIYFSLAHLELFPNALFFTYAIRLSSIPALFLIAVLFGLIALGYRILRSQSLILNVGIGASLYIGVEWILFCVFGGYYYGSLAHAVVSFPPVLVIASLGGVPLVSFLVALGNVLLGEIMHEVLQGKRKILYAGIGICAGLTLLGLIFARIPQERELRPALTVAVIQTGEYLPFGAETNAVFSDSALEPIIMDAADTKLVIYPFTPVKGVAYVGDKPSLNTSLDAIEDNKLGVWVSRLVPPTTTVMLWNTLADHNLLYDEYVFWQAGERSEYRKQQLYALSDAPPLWARLLGLQKSPFTVTPGEPGNTAQVAGVRVGGLICSELHQSGLVREQARTAPFLIAVGSDVMFPGDLSGNFSLAAARYRAAENNIPIVRGNIIGPSAIINSDGSIAAQLSFGKSGILKGSIPMRKGGNTFYSRWGDTPLLATLMSIFAFALFINRRARSPGSSGQE